MATTTSEVQVYDSFKQFLQNGQIDVDTDVWIMGLSTTTYVPNKATHEAIADITNEVVGNGYVRQTLASVTLTEPVAGTWQFDSANAVFTATGGSIVAHYYWIFDDSTTVPVDALFCYGLLDTTPLSVTTTDTNTLTIQVNVNGYYRLSGG